MKLRNTKQTVKIKRTVKKEKQQEEAYISNQDSTQDSAIFRLPFSPLANHMTIKRRVSVAIMERKLESG